VQPASHLWTYSLVSVILVSLLSLIGLAFISVGEEKLKRIIFVMVSLAVGGLFGDAFIHLLPESFERLGSNLQASLYVLAGIFAFFVLEVSPLETRARPGIRSFHPSRRVHEFIG